MKPASTQTDPLPRWDVTDVYPSLTDRRFITDLEQAEAGVTRLVALFDRHAVRGGTPRPAAEDDAAAADEIIAALNEHQQLIARLGAFVHSYVSTDSYDAVAQGVASQIDLVAARLRPLTARLAAWVAGLGATELASLSEEAAAHVGPLTRLAARAAHQMSETDEGLYAELVPTGSSAWARLHADVTSQLSAPVRHSDGTTTVMPMAAVRGLATNGDPVLRRAAFEAEIDAWPSVSVPCAAAMNAIKGEANVVNRRRLWDSPLDASLFANSVSRETFDAMHEAVLEALPDFRRWMRVKARLHGHDGALPWWDLVAPCPVAAAPVPWEHSLGIVRGAFQSFGGQLGGLVDRALDERWIDAAPRAGKRGGAFCMPFVGDRSLVFLNWTDSLTSTQTTAHELGHAYHNVQLAGRTPLQRQLPMALAETASIFCETLVTEHSLLTASDDARLALLDVDLAGANQVVVDIHSRLLFETEVFTRRQRRTLSADELSEMMQSAQADAYADGLDQSTAHPYMWAVKPHYYSSHFYNWPYTYGLLFGLGLFATYRADPDRFRLAYDDALSRAGIDDALTLGAAFGFDVSDVGFWRSSLDVLRARIAEYTTLAAKATV
jgi:pepF/M3 family oligoendopeptidase